MAKLANSDVHICSFSGYLHRFIILIYIDQPQFSFVDTLLNKIDVATVYTCEVSLLYMMMLIDIVKHQIKPHQI